MRGKLKGFKKQRGQGLARLLSKRQKMKLAEKQRQKPPKKKGEKLVSVADFIHNEKVKEKEILVEVPVEEEADQVDEEVAASEGILKFAKNLAHTEKSIRDKGFKTLGKFLKAQTNLSYKQFLKIWKGLYMCIWMTDKPPVQANVAQKMGALIHEVPQGETMSFIRAFWDIIARQWAILDRLRIDKIYKLMRFIIKESFVFLKANAWDDTLVRTYLAILAKGPLSPTSHAGVIGHICDVYVEELQRTIEEDLPAELGVLLLEPFIMILAKAPTKITFMRVTDAVFDRLTGEAITYRLLRKEIQKGTKEHVFFPDSSLLSARLFEVAGSLSTLEGNRKKLFSLSEKFKTATPPQKKKGPKTAQKTSVVNGTEEATPKETDAPKVSKANKEKGPLSKKAKKEEQKKPLPAVKEKETSSSKDEAEGEGDDGEDDEDFSDMVDLDALEDLDEKLDNMDEEEIKLVEEEVKRVLEKKKALNEKGKSKKREAEVAPAAPEPKPKKPKIILEVPVHPQVAATASTETKVIKGILSPRLSRDSLQSDSPKKNVTILTEKNKVKKFLFTHPPKVVATTPESSPYLEKKKKRQFLVQSQ